MTTPATDTTLTAAVPTIEQLLDHETAKDLRLNLRLLREARLLTPAQAWGTALASAFASRNVLLTRAVAAEAAQHLGAEGARAARVAATMMGLTNVYYRFLHLVEAPEYGQLPAGFRMQSLANPGVPRLDFELWSLAASAIKGCGGCVKSHERHLREAGASPELIQEAVRIASLVHAAATAADAPAYAASLIVSSPFFQLQGQSSSVWRASSTRSVSSTFRPTDRSFTLTCRMMPSGSTMKVARRATPSFLSSTPSAVESSRLMSASIGKGSSFRSTWFCRQARCTNSLSVLAASTWQSRSANWLFRSAKPLISVGHTNVKSFG